MTCQHKTAVDNFLYQGKCIECRREKGRRHYAKHKEKVLAKAAEYRKQNPERVKQFKKAYAEKIKNLSFIKPEQSLPKRELFYVNKLKSIIYELSQLERRYRKHGGIA